MSTHRLLLSIALATALVAGCERKTADSQPAAVDSGAAESATEASLLASNQHAWQRSIELARQGHASVAALKLASASLLSEPSAETLAASRDSWHKAHQKFLLLAPFFSLGDANPGLFALLQSNRFEIDGWPITPGYLDYFDVYAHSGIVNDIAIPINAESIRGQHWLTSEEDISLGFHAIAYLLWGENQQRKASEFLPQTRTAQQKKNGLRTIDLPNQRRAALLQLQIELLSDDINLLIYRLEQSASALNTSYQALPAPVQLELWRGGLQHLLLRLLQQDLLPPEQADSDWEYHNRFAGQTATAIGLELEAIKQLLLEHGEGQQPLGYWLLSGAQIDPAVAALDTVILRLQDYQQPWSQLPIELATELRSELQKVVQLLQ